MVELIIAALAAGAAAGVSGAASAAVTDAYDGLRTLARKALRGVDVGADQPDQEAVAVIDDQLDAPEEHRDELTAALTAAGAEQDTELIEAARRVLRLTKADGADASKYRVDLRDNTGVQVGDGNNMTLDLRSM